MRRLSKGEEPEYLKRNATRLAEEYAQDSAKSPWRRKEIIEALIAETSGKCAYCESKITAATYPHVEHRRPRSKFPDLVVLWANLTLACSVCNTAKRDYFDESAPLLDPYEHDPMEHLSIVGPLIEGRPGSVIGSRTVNRLALRRLGLIVERSKRIQALHTLIERWHVADGSDREIMADVIRDELGDDVEFCQTLRCYARTQGFHFGSEA